METTPREHNDWTLEIVPGHAEQIDCLKGLVDEIFITMIPGTDPQTVLDAVSKVASAGFLPAPHMAARAFSDEVELGRFCDRLKDLCVEKALVIGGGQSVSAGTFSNSMQILQSKAFQRSGISNVALAGHPEGNPVDPETKQNLLDKLTWLKNEGIGAEVVTQWSFSSEKMNVFLQEINSVAPDLKVRVGIAGPASLKTLLKYAKICGITAATEVLKKQGLSFGRLLIANDPAKFAGQINHSNLFHLYPFGGLEKCARWLRMNAPAAAKPPA